MPPQSCPAEETGSQHFTTSLCRGFFCPLPLLHRVRINILTLVSFHTAPKVLFPFWTLCELSRHSHPRVSSADTTIPMWAQQTQPSPCELSRHAPREDECEDTALWSGNCEQWFSTEDVWFLELWLYNEAVTYSFDCNLGIRPYCLFTLLVKQKNRLSRQSTTQDSDSYWPTIWSLFLKFSLIKWTAIVSFLFFFN